MEAQPAELVPGESATISLQPYETPAEEVMIPDQTWINVQTSLVGDLLGGLGLPAFGVRYFQGFARVPWGLLKGTDIVYEVLPDSLLPFSFDTLQVPIIAYSPYDQAKAGSTTIKVTKKVEAIYTRFSQVDPQWADSTYDTDIKNITETDTTYYNIGAKGCALTAMAMILNAASGELVTPLDLNKDMLENKEYYHSNVKWNAINDYNNSDTDVTFSKIIGRGYSKKNKSTIPLNKLDPFLEKGQPIIAQVFNKTTDNVHWVLITSKVNSDYKILDPGYKERRSLSDYGNEIYRSVIYKFE